MRALRPNALPLARQHESRYRTACHGHVSLYVTANKPAGGKIKNNKTLSGGPCSRFNTICFFICFVLRFLYCATLMLTLIGVLFI